MAYDPRGQYKAPPRPYYQNRAPPNARQPPQQQGYQNQSYGFAQDPYAGEQRPDSYKGYDGDGFLDDYGVDYQEQGRYNQQYQGGYGGYDQRQPPRPRQQYPPQNAQQPRPGPDPRAGRGPPQNFNAPVNQQSPNGGYGQPPPSQRRPTPPNQMQNSAYGPPDRMQNGGYGQQPSAQRRGTPPGQRQNDGYGRPATAPQGGTPPRQRFRKLPCGLRKFNYPYAYTERQPLVEPNSPETLPFDNPFPVFNAKPKPKPREDGVTQAMGDMDNNGRPSMERQRRPTDASKASQQSSGSSGSRQGNYPQYEDSYSNSAPRQGQPPFRRPSLPDERGQMRRANTMPEEQGYPAPDRRQQQGANDYGRQGYDGGPGPVGPPVGYRDPIQQRSFTTQGERPPPQQQQLPPRSQSSMGNRGPPQQPNGYRRQPSWDDNMVGRGAPRAFQQQSPPQRRQQRGPDPYGQSYPQEVGGYQAYNAGPSPPPRGGDLESYMPDFDTQPSKPLEDPIGLPLDIAAGGKRSGNNSPGANAPEVYQQPRSARSQPDLRQPPPGPYQAGLDAPPMPRGPPNGPDPMGRQRDPYGNGPMNGPSPVQSPPQQQRQYGIPNNPRGFNRPEVLRNESDQSVWSDPGPSPGSRMNDGPRPVRPGLNTRAQPQQSYPREPKSAQEPSRSFHPDALPAHPAPIRPGLMNENRPPMGSDKPGPARMYGNSPSPANSQPPSSSSSQKQESRRLSSTPVTADEINRLRATLKANPSDKATELILAKRLSQAAVTLVSQNQDSKTKAREREGYIKEADKHVKKLVGQNYPEAMFYLADCYGTGQMGLAIDPKEAFGLYQSAAKLGHAASAYRTAVCCEMGGDSGGGTRKDPLKAVQWYRRAATLGDVPAMYKLGMILLKGLLGQQASIGEAMIWLQRAAQQADEENPHALHELAQLYETAPPGGKVIRDEQYAFQLYEQAARLGYKVSQNRLGKAFEYGHLGQAINNRSSIHWYSKAAAQGDVEAELALSGWYLTGSEGILQQSDTEAYLWARKAAMREFAKAEFAMGYFSEVGIGCPKSLEDAKRWYGRAAGEFDFPFPCCSSSETDDMERINTPRPKNVSRSSSAVERRRRKRGRGYRGVIRESIVMNALLCNDLYHRLYKASSAGGLKGFWKLVFEKCCILVQRHI